MTSVYDVGVAMFWMLFLELENEAKAHLPLTCKSQNFDITATWLVCCSGGSGVNCDHGGKPSTRYLMHWNVSMTFFFFTSAVLQWLNEGHSKQSSGCFLPFALFLVDKMIPHCFKRTTVCFYGFTGLAMFLRSFFTSVPGGIPWWIQIWCCFHN